MLTCASLPYDLNSEEEEPTSQRYIVRIQLSESANDTFAPRWLNLRELGPWASHMRWIIWIMASGGTLYVFFFHERYKLVELLCYLIMGFFPALVILSMPNTDGLVELVAGGIFYCFGTVFFKSDGRIPFAHAIWHLFVAFGAGTHYYAIWRYLYRPDALNSHISR
ncbi:monocyte to macrophage differentiation factor 2 [Thamnophis elegans]|uniref:monocyte to macrophage differentiation factor 2 n=1 Tax=Thamnophis elegans TaxID=35005 RepID=UPI001376EC45|nr:monocyte to macrophage differentiation factor 2 [Thamnophis elegans]